MLGRTISVLIIACVLFALVGASDVSAAASGQRTLSPPTHLPQEVESWRVIRELTTEAKRSLRGDRTFLRTQSDYGIQKNVAIDNHELIRLLSRRINSKPATDAYIKWQLLSFGPDLGQATAEQVARMLRVMPQLTPHPGPDVVRRSKSRSKGADGLQLDLVSVTRGRTRRVPIRRGALAAPTLGVIKTGLGLSVNGTVSADNRYVTATVQTANSDLIPSAQNCDLVQCACGCVPR